MIACTVCGAEAVVQWRRKAAGRGGADTVPVYGCADHALSPEAAAYAHEATCAGPGKAGTCACPPAAAEHPFPGPDAPRKRMPPRW